MGNNALTVNPKTQNAKHVDIAITTQGSDWYFAVCALMGVTTLAMIGAAYKKNRGDRVFFYITAAVNMVATVAYFSMGSNLGWTPIDVEFRRSDPHVSGVNREIYYVRYIDWFLTTPLLLMDLLLTAGLPWPTILWTILIDEVMIVTGLVGALVKSRYKWGYYGFACAALLYVFYILLVEGPKQARPLGGDILKVYRLCGIWTLLLWLCYPIAWAVCEGSNLISPDSEAIFYGVLDCLAKPGFSVMLILGHWNINPARLGLTLRDYAQLPAPPMKEGDGPDSGIISNGHGADNNLSYAARHDAPDTAGIA